MSEPKNLKPRRHYCWNCGADMGLYDRRYVADRTMFAAHWSAIARPEMRSGSGATRRTNNLTETCGGGW